MSLLIIAYCLLLRSLNALHHERAVVAFSPNAAAAFLWNGSGDHRSSKAKATWTTSKHLNWCIRLLASEQPDKSGVMELLLAKDAVAGKPKKKLLDQVRDAMRLKHYSLWTEC
jgi:hypothetical protein